MLMKNQQMLEPDAWIYAGPLTSGNLCSSSLLSWLHRLPKCWPVLKEADA